MMLTIQQLAERWNLSRERIATMIAARQVPAIDTARKGAKYHAWRFPLAAIEAVERGEAVSVSAQPTTRRPRKRKRHDPFGLCKD